jgi:translation initiation factor 2 subunit 3
MTVGKRLAKKTGAGEKAAKGKEKTIPAKPAAKERETEAGKVAVAGSRGAPGAKRPAGIPEMNIGLVGHVDHGKTTLTEALSGKWTDTHSEEIKRGITIRLGYADVTLYECPKCKSHGRYGTTDKCIRCFSKCRAIKTVSLVDAPGHETLMATVLAGAAMMDGAILLIAANERCPQPQTREHLTALNIVGIKNIVVVQNKIDLVSEEDALKNYGEIESFLKGSIAEDAPVIPVSAQQRINIDALVEAMARHLPTPKRDPNKTPRMLVARSFDVNRPGTHLDDIQGGVLGGSLVEGRLRVGDEVEISPGVEVKNDYRVVRTVVTGLQKAGRDLKEAGPGGLIGVGTGLDPGLAKSDGLGGNLLGRPGTLPGSVRKVTLDVRLLEKVVGTETQQAVEQLKAGDTLVMTAGISRSVGTVSGIGRGRVEIDLKVPMCIERGQKAALSRQVMGRWRLIGWGDLV